MNYTDQNFDITEIQNFNTIEGLLEISNYLDFAIDTAIQKQLPGMRKEQETMYVTGMIRRFLNGNTAEFTNTYNIRENMNKVGPTKIKFLLWKTLIERKAFNEQVVKSMVSTEVIDEVAITATEMIARGEFDEINAWFTKNKDTLISNYILMKYKQGDDIKKQYDTIAHQNPLCEKALEQLGMELQLQQTIQK